MLFQRSIKKLQSCAEFVCLDCIKNKVAWKSIFITKGGGTNSKDQQFELWFQSSQIIVSFIKVKPLPSLQLLSCHDHVECPQAYVTTSLYGLVCNLVNGISCFMSYCFLWHICVSIFMSLPLFLFLSFFFSSLWASGTKQCLYMQLWLG